MSAYRRPNKQFQAAIAKCADQLREAQQIVEIVRNLQDELVPLLIMLWADEHRKEALDAKIQN